MTVNKEITMDIYQTPKNLEAIRYAVVQRFIKLFSDKELSILVSSSTLANDKKQTTKRLSVFTFVLFILHLA